MFHQPKFWNSFRNFVRFYSVWRWHKTTILDVTAGAQHSYECPQYRKPYGLVAEGLQPDLVLLVLKLIYLPTVRRKLGLGGQNMTHFITFDVVDLCSLLCHQLLLCHHIFAFDLSFPMSTVLHFVEFKHIISNVEDHIMPAYWWSFSLSSCSDNEDIRAYVKEMAKEITAEIKSEIREVISQVEDVLENSEAVDLQTVMANISRWILLKLKLTHCFIILNFLRSFQCGRLEERCCVSRWHRWVPQRVFKGPDERGQIGDSRSFKRGRWIHLTRLHDL